MADHTPHQKKIISRYYAHKSGIMLAKLSECVGELYLAESDTQRDRLWARVEKAMRQLKVRPALAAHILATRDPKILASHISDWLSSSDTG